MRETSEDANASSNRRGLAVLGYVLTGIVVTLILAGVKMVIENSTWGHEYRLWAYGKLQTVRSSVDPNNPIALIDLSDVSDEQSGEPSLREKIQEIIDALVNLPYRPMAIAVDVDFSPSPTGHDSVENAKFFDFCLGASQKVPICLAVANNKAAAPHQWLGNEKYQKLACAVALNPNDTRKVPLWVRAENQPQTLNMMNYSLALIYREKFPEPPRWINWALDRSGEEDPRNIKVREETSRTTQLIYGERLVSYSKLEAMKQAARKDTSPESIRNTGSGYEGKLVILGDVSRPRDFFPVPGTRHDQAGSLILASATYTLIKEPLFEFHHSVSVFLDLLIAALIIAAVAIIRYRNPNNFFLFGKQAVFIYASIGFVLVAGVLLAWLWGVIWMDFLLVASALFLHPKLEQLLHKIFSRKKSPPTTVSAPTRETQEPPEQGPIVPDVVSSIIAIIIATLVIAPAALAQDASTLCKERVAAVALRLKVDSKPTKKKKKKKLGDCYFRENDEAESQKLAEADMKTKAFIAGQQLYCDKDCVLTLWLCDTHEEYEVKQALYSVFHPYRPGSVIDPNPGKPARQLKASNPRTTASRVEFRSYAKTAEVERYGVVSGIAQSTAKKEDTAASTGVYKEALKGQRAKQTYYELEAKFLELLVQANEERDAKNFSEAEQHYREAAELIPLDSRSFHGLGNVYLDQQKFMEAEDAYRKAVALWSDSADAHVALAAMLMQPKEGTATAERLTEAEEILKKATRVQPNDETVHQLLRSALEMRAASNDEIEAVYRRMLRFNPRSVETNLSLSTLLYRSGRRNEAKERARIAERSASGAEELMEVAKVFESQGHYDRAERAVRRALTLSPKSSRALLILGLILIDRERYEQAMVPLERSIEASPSGFAPHHLLGIAQLRSGNLKVAEQSFDLSVKQSTPTGEKLFATVHSLGVLGDTYAAAGSKTEALRIYEKALRYDPEALEIRKKLTKLRARLNQ